MKVKITLTKFTAWALLCLGAIALIISIFYSSSILAFIGLGLIFWGAILAYIQTEEYIKETLLDATIQPYLTTLNQLIKELDYKGNATYLPPKYFQEPETVKIYIPRQKSTKIPPPEEIQKHEKQLFTQNPQSLLLTPPGIGLTKLFEETLETSFTKLNLEQLQNSLPKLLIEDLEIAENLEIRTEFNKATTKIKNQVSVIQTKEDTICVKITKTIYKNICNEARKLSHICKTVGCPLCSAIACAITKASGKPVTIQKTESAQDGGIIEAYYSIIEEEKELRWNPKNERALLTQEHRRTHQIAKETHNQLNPLTRKSET